MKKLIASILSIAMVLSMFTMVFSANTEKETNYSAIVEELQDLAEELIQVGPALYYANHTLTNGYGWTDKGQRMAAAMVLAENSYRANYNVEFTTLELYYEDANEQKISYGVAPEKLFTDVDAFIAELEKSQAVLDVVALLGGYTSVKEAAEAYTLNVGKANDLRVKFSNMTKQVQDTWPTSGSPKWEYEVDEDGNTKVDANGKPIFKLDDDGNKIPVMKTVSIFEDAPADIQALFNTKYTKLMTTAELAAAQIDLNQNQAAAKIADWMIANGYEEFLPAPKGIGECSDAVEIIELVLLYADAAIRFGENADADYLAPEFNAGRVKVYNNAINAVKAVLKALRKQVTATNCPYAEELELYTKFEEQSAEIYGEAVYNESYGINPWAAVKGQLSGLLSDQGILAGYQWMSFAEIAAYSETAAQLLTSFQAQLRTASLYNVNGKLYAEFVGDLEALYDTFEDLCWELVGGKDAAQSGKTYPAMQETVEALIDLWYLEQLYTMYVEPAMDLYAQSVQNISTIYNLRGQIEMAREILDTVDYDSEHAIPWYGNANLNGEGVIPHGYNTIKFTNAVAKIQRLSAEAVNNFVANIEANIAALVPAAGQQITAAEIAEGLALYNKVGNLLDYYANESERINTYVPLYNLYRDFGNYLPASVGADAVANINYDIHWLADAANAPRVITVSDVYGTKDGDNVEIDVSYYLEFAPVAYYYLTLISEVGAAVDAFEYEVSKLNMSAPDLGYSDPATLKAVSDKYDFLTWYDNIVVGDDGEYELYWHILTGTDNTGCWLNTEDTVVSTTVGDNADASTTTDAYFGEGSFYAIVMGDPAIEAGDELAYDYAVRNFANFVTAFQAVREYLSGWWKEPGTDSKNDYFEEITHGKYDYPEDGDKIDFSGDFSILDVVVTNGDALRDALIENLEYAASLLCVNVTDRIAMFDWVNDELADIFDLVLVDKNATYYVDETVTSGYGAPSYYVEGELANLAEAMTVLNQLITRYYTVETDIELDWTNGTFIINTEEYINRATPAKLEAAFEAVKEALYNLFTAKGAACLDAFFAQIELTLDAKVYGNKNDIGDVKEALDNHVNDIKKYFPAESEMRPYEYFAWTLKTVANYSDAANIYGLGNKTPVTGETYFYINFYKAFAKVVSDVNSVVTGQYPTAIREDAAKLAFFANDILAGINYNAENATAFTANDWNADNMPLWYGLELTQYLADYVAEAKTQSAAALQSLKAEVLAPVIADAETIQTAFLANSIILGRAYDAAQDVMANSKNGALYIYTAEEINAAAEALAAQVELAKAELGDAVYTVEDVIALIDALVAKVEARATGMAADLKDLRVAASEAKTEIAAGEFRQSSYVEAVVDAANDALEALIGDVKLADEKLYTPASYEAYEAAYNTLMDVVDVDAEVELTVAEALAAFKAAEAELVLLADATGAMYEAAVAALEAAKAVDGTKYTAESYAAFEAAVAALQAAVDNYASDAELQAAIVNVKVAEVQLVVATVDEVGTLDD